MDNEPPPTKPTPRVDVLERLQNIFTVEQLNCIAQACEQVRDQTGYGRVTIHFNNAHPKFLESSPKIGL